MPTELTFSDWLGLVGILLSLLGFGLAIWQLKKTKSAAESASTAASEAKDAIRHLNALLEFNSLAKVIDEIIGALREDRLENLPALLGATRKSIVSARETHRTLSTEQNARIDKALTFIRALEIKFDKDALKDNKLSKQKILRRLIDISDLSTEILSSPKTQDHLNGAH